VHGSAPDIAGRGVANPLAMFLSVAMMGVGYLLFAYATVSGFRDNGAALSAATIPFITVAHGALAACATPVLTGTLGRAHAS